jgi:3D (Asp-Asp-Asp) domain-containing protein
MKILSFISVIATAYCNHGVTASGYIAARGTVAVDRRTIPLGSSLIVPGYGFGRAWDTGGAIKGHRVDVWFSSCRQAILWGRKRLRIKLLTSYR